MHSARPAGSGDAGVDAGLQRLYTEQGRFTAGVATHYQPSLITAEAVHQHLATGFRIGERFHSAPVVRLADAKRMELGHAAQADGRWRLYAFADAADPRDPASRLRGLCDFLADGEESPVRRFTPAGADVDAVFDVRAVLQQGHRDLSVAGLPPLLLPRKGRFGLVDYEKVFCPDPKSGPDVFELRGVDRDRGCVVVVRPDQYVAHVLPLDEHGALADFFTRFMAETRTAVVAG
jgi:phenol 2-monooxygenase